jgi:hypothetical protein
MEKFCVFCGNKPQNKNNEHVLPRWLIESTGDPKREVGLGHDKKKKGFPIRSFSFDQFKFPSCSACNEEFSDLETHAKSIIEKIMLLDNLTAEELSVLLDWFDKLRIGIWLGYFYLDKNWAGISPNYYINQRMSEADRLLCIYRAQSDRKCLSFFGCETISFYHAPCCFALRINNFYFFNMSYSLLFSRRMGLPYASEVFWVPDKQDPENHLTVARGTGGRERVMTPLLKKQFHIQGTELYQPMFPSLMQQENASTFYDTDYVHKMSMNWEKGVGNIFKQDGSMLSEYPHKPVRDWLPSEIHDINTLTKSVIIQTLEWQIYINDNGPSVDRLPKDMQKTWLRQRKWCNYFNQQEVQKVEKIIFTGK